MKQELIEKMTLQMSPYLNNEQSMRLMDVLKNVLAGYSVIPEGDAPPQADAVDYVSAFLSAKRIEGCSEKTLAYYGDTIKAALDGIGKTAAQITTEDLRAYLANYQQERGISKVTADNIRRNLSSFFQWLEDENYILKSPVRRIHKIKAPSRVKQAFTDEEIERIRDHCKYLRDLAMIDMLASTGMRVGELVGLNIANVNLEERECVVLGKGDKERPAYFDAQTKLHLEAYLSSRSDDNQALFVSMRKPYRRLTVNAVETRLRNIGQALNIENLHPHRFRRTMATTAIDKGMPIEQVQRLLGHTKIDTTLGYAMVKQENVKLAHRKYIG